MSVTVKLKVNGEERLVQCSDTTLLVDLIRNELDLPGTRVGCLNGDCGSCTVQRDGMVIKSCLELAAAADGREIVTIEGARSREFKAVQRAFIEQHGFQCGYCTSGMLMVAADLLTANHAPSDADVRQAISGNLCRCTGYDDIVRAIQAAARDLATERSDGTH